MRGALLTIRGLYKWDNSIFDGLSLPPGPDKQLAIDTIIARCDCFNVLYADPNAMKAEIERWSKTELYTFTTLWNTTVLEYNPIDNFDRHEEWSEEIKRDETFGKGVTLTSNKTGTDTKGTTASQEASGTTTPGSTLDTTTSVKAFNDITTWTDREKSHSVNGGADSFENKGKTSFGGSDSFDHKDVDVWSGNDTEKANNSVKHTGHLRGNIGVTTTQQMIEQERQIAMYNFYEFVADSFKIHFCVMVY